MTREADKLKERHQSERNPVERQKIRTDLDQIPLSSGELDQVKEREANRKAADIEAFHSR